ncbi:hypothetical protein OSB04_030356, partial [Centaurea solstitialis]
MVVIQVQLQLHHPLKFNGFSQHPSVYNIQRSSKKLSIQASRTQRIMEGISVNGEVGGAGGAYSYDALKRLDNLWSSLCSDQRVVQEPKQVVLNTPGLFSESDEEKKWRNSMCWFAGNRCGFERKGEIWVENILNLGVSPAKLIDIMRERFNSLGGVIFEGCSVSSIHVYQDIAVLQLTEGKILSARLIIDAMGNFSPILKQIRGGKKPDGMCLVVGSCCRGFKENSNSDVIFSSAESKPVGNSEAQYFWEAFPAGSGPLDRTTYMFTYLEPQSSSPKLEELLEDYWDLMPKYQEVALDELEILRVIYGIFPTYRDSPLPAAFDRVLQFGDASGIQSPVSFGGFGSLTRHLGRITNGIHEAMSANLLDSDNLSLLNPYMPNLSASWLFQRAMSARKQAGVSPDFINELLYANFQSMQRLGDPVLRPFLQDVIQFGPLVKTLGLVMLTNPQILPSIFKQVGFPVLIDWLGHFSLLGSYTFLSIFIDPLIRPMIDTFPTETRYKWRRQLEAWKYGSGLDYKFESEDVTRSTLDKNQQNQTRASP